MPASVPALYHPTLAVHDLEAARDWFRRVFNRPPLRWEETLDLNTLNPEYPVNYSFFAFICDIHWVFLCPALHAQGALKGQARYQHKPEGMIGLGWYANDAVAMFAKLGAHGIRSHNQRGERITAQQPPTSSFLPDVFTGFTEPEDTGIRYEFQETGRRHWAKYSEKADLRLRPDWRGPELDPEDPLGLLLTSHHTIVTADLGRAFKLYTQILEGEEIQPIADVEAGRRSTFVRLADTILEFQVPLPGTELWTRVSEGEDYYQGVTYLVVNTDNVNAHLDDAGIPYIVGADGETIIPSASGFGVQWRFVWSLPYCKEARRPPAF
ncbi:VOC family protein [Pseudomonas sp. 32A]|uniref:VOC family protein n=1 Tax=Pseudomonas sp. 32A TaxID=651185 RepID=UPI0040454DE4